MRAADGSDYRADVAEPRMVQISLYVECDDDAEIERLSDAIALVACPEQDDVGASHRCSIPWFVVSSDGDELETWRDLLNR